MNKSKIKMQITKRNCQTLTDVRTVIAMSKDDKYKKFPNHQRVKCAIFASDYSWQERLRWINRIIHWKGPRGENFDWQCVLHNSTENAQKISREKADRIRGEKNPAYNHGGRLSPFSDKFIGKTTKDEAIAKMKQTKSANPERLNTRLEYYLTKELSLEEAKFALKERQAVGSLKNFISRYGEKEGGVKWKKRQEKWLDTLNSKTEEERARINALKLGNGYSVSKAKKELYESLSKWISELKRNLSVSYNEGKNYYVYDIYFENKIIEYNGDFWHANPKIYNEEFFNPVSKMTYNDIHKKEKHKEKIALLNGYTLHRVWESDYKKNPKKEIRKCIGFLTK